MSTQSKATPAIGNPSGSPPAVEAPCAPRFRKPKSFVETVADYLRESILRGEMKPGEKINQNKVLEEMGISSIPFREALRLLEKEGLIVSRSGKGSWVAGISHRDLEETFEMREMIEVFALELIRKREAEGVNVKEKLGSLFRAVHSDNIGPEFCLDFHLNLIQLADNSKLLNLYVSLSNNIRRYQSISYPVSSHSCIEEHLPILSPLLAGDYEGAKLAVRRHLSELKSSILESAEFSD